MKQHTYTCGGHTHAGILRSKIQLLCVLVACYVMDSGFLCYTQDSCRNLSLLTFRNRADFTTAGSMVSMTITYPRACQFLAKHAPER